MKDTNINKYIVDASIIAAFLLPYEDIDAKIQKIFDLFVKGDCQLLAPKYLQIEVANAVRSVVYRKLLRKEEGNAIIESFLLLPIQYQNINLSEVFAVSLKHSLTVYDACYLWLSQSEKIPLLTLDKALQRVNE